MNAPETEADLERLRVESLQGRAESIEQLVDEVKRLRSLRGCPCSVRMDEVEATIHMLVGRLQTVEDQIDGPQRPPQSNRDHVGDFVAACCSRGQGLTVQSSILYDAYSAWGKANNKLYLSHKGLVTRLKSRGFESFKSGQMFFRGIALQEEAMGMNGGVSCERHRQVQ